MIDVDQVALFRLGRIAATPGVISNIPPEDTVEALLRHSQGEAMRRSRRVVRFFGAW